MCGGIEYLFKKNKVTYVKGTAKFNSKNTLIVDLSDEDGQLDITAKNILIATGSYPVPSYLADFDNNLVLSPE